MIFISYASEDLTAALTLFDALEAEGLHPWLDKKKILPGQDFDSQIWVAATRAEFFCILLSPRSVNKRGFVRKEMRFALEKWKEKLPDDVYLIPCRIDNAEIPFEFRPLQYCNLNTTEDLRSLVTLLKEQTKKSNAHKLAPETDEFETKIFQRETEGLNLRIEFPNFRKPELLAINKSIGEIVKDVTQMADELDTKPIHDNPKSDVELGFRVTRGSDNIVSVFFSGYWYGSGAAHPNSFSRTINFSLATKRPIRLSELFIEPHTALQIISTACCHHLIAQKAIDFGMDDVDEDWIVRGTKAEWENFGSWVLDKGRLRIFFDAYSVGPYAWGPRVVEIELGSLQDRLSAEIGKVDWD